LNAHGNLHMAYQSLIDRLVHDIQESQDPCDGNQSTLVLNSVSYQLVQNLVHRQILSSTEEPGTPSYFQFKIVIDREDFLISPTHEV
jgi:hypothetical protein